MTDEFDKWWREENAEELREDELRYQEDLAFQKELEEE